MLDRRGLALATAAAIMVSFPPPASAQGYCDQYPWAWQCRNPWAHGQPRPASPWQWQQQQQQPAEAEPPQYYQQQPYYRPQPHYDQQESSRAAPARPRESEQTSLDPASARQYASLYAEVDDQFRVPAVNLSQVDPAFLRRTVYYPTREAPGTIIIDPAGHYLYLIQADGKAIRYGVGVGRQGFGWSGVANVHDKQQWPDWYPPKEMLARQPELMRHMSELQSGIGMPGGLSNPLGARALYLWQGNKDTLYRIHGTNEPWTIGHSVSSGCIRMLNQDVMDLYERAPVGAKVVVLGRRLS
jgi:lipoprotein-anchoring transpeptidase ErfK/SrfK